VEAATSTPSTSFTMQPADGHQHPEPSTASPTSRSSRTRADEVIGTHNPHSGVTEMFDRILAQIITQAVGVPACLRRSKIGFIALPQMVNRIIATYAPAPPIPGIHSTGTTFPADYIHHCHILEHEDNDMMRPWQLLG
jgi:hypothetical protein